MTGRPMRSPLATLVLWLGLAWAQVAGAAPMQHVFLVQNSGWMEPFYVDPASRLMPLVASVVRAVAAPDDPTSILAFSQGTPDNASPKEIRRGAGPGDTEAALAGIALATRNKGRALADTDFAEAVHDAERRLASRPGIIWIFTNNKNSPNNDPQTLLRNEDFYRLLHTDPAIERTLAYPVGMPVRGKLYRASGLMVYALAYGEEASRRLAGLAEGAALKGVFDRPPARLKPIDRESVRLIPKGVVNTPNVTLGLGRDGRTLVIDVDATKVLPVVRIQAAFQNLFYPYVIEHARPAAVLAGAWGRSDVGIAPAALDRIRPGEGRDVTITLPLPLGQIGSPWSMQAIRAMGKELAIPALLTVSLADQRLVLSSEFRQSLDALFPGDPLPRFFLPPESVTSSSASTPLLIRIHYPLLPVIVAVLGGLTALGGLVGAGVALRRETRFDVRIDGATRAVRIKAFGTQQIRSDDGTVIGSLRRSLGKPSVVQVADGHTLELK